MLPGMLPSIISIQSANGVRGKVMLALRSGVLLVSECPVSSIYTRKQLLSFLPQEEIEYPVGGKSGEKFTLSMIQRYRFLDVSLNFQA